jgi:hypothetical protein
MLVAHLRREGTFDVGWWRSLLTDVAGSCKPALRAISPFGFEVLRNPAFYRRDLFRFYVYVQATDASAAPADELFAERLLTRLRDEAPAFHADLHEVITAQSRRWPNPGGNRTLRIWPVAGSEPLLSQYSRYVAMAPAGIVSHRLREMELFSRSRACRRYIFQLALMTSRLYQPECHALGAAQHAELSQLIRELSPLISNPSGAVEPASERERDALRTTVLPHMRAIVQALDATPSRDRIVVSTRDLHGPRTIAAGLPRPVLARKQAFVARSYTRFEPPPESPRPAWSRGRASTLAPI